MPWTKTPARRLVEAFGDCDALAAMYTDDVTWRLNHSLASRIKGPHVGKDATCAFNRAVFTKFYRPGSVTVEILDEIGTAVSSVVRFNFRAVKPNGKGYNVEYVLFCKTRGEKIYEVVELLDTHASNQQHAGKSEVGVPPPLSTFAAPAGARL